MEKKSLQRREGFWHSTLNPELPFPLPQPQSGWRGKRKFVKLLTHLQEAIDQEDYRGSGRRDHYKGWSNCRICGRRNGSTEYYYRGWSWPEGFLHYVTEHNVRPSLAFQEFILGRHIEYTEKDDP